jgi:phospholipase C
MKRRWCGLALLAWSALTACARGAMADSLLVTGPDPAPEIRPYLSLPTYTRRRAELIAALRKHVRYVFVLYQENRSFDAYFGSFPGAHGL